MRIVHHGERSSSMLVEAVTVLQQQQPWHGPAATGCPWLGDSLEVPPRTSRASRPMAASVLAPASCTLWSPRRTMSALLIGIGILQYHTNLHITTWQGLKIERRLNKIIYFIFLSPTYKYLGNATYWLGLTTEFSDLLFWVGNTGGPKLHLPLLLSAPTISAVPLPIRFLTHDAAIASLLTSTALEQVLPTVAVLTHSSFNKPPG